MFTFAAFALFVVIAFAAGRANAGDRRSYDAQPSDDPGLWLLLLHVRQDLKLVAYLLGGIMVMLGVVADRFA